MARVVMVTAQEYGASLKEPIKVDRVTELCREGRVPGAIKCSVPGRGKRWMIPAGAVIRRMSPAELQAVRRRNMRKAREALARKRLASTPASRSAKAGGRSRT